MKATWRGYITLGLVGFEVQLYNATKRSLPSFTLLHEKDKSPIERVPFCRGESKEINSTEIVRGVAQNGSYLTFTEQELERAAGSQKKTLEIRQFCDQADIDLMHYQKPYYIVPGDKGKRAYALVREALLRTGKVAIARFVLHGKEHVGAIQPLDGMLLLHQLRFAAEIVPRSDIKRPALDKPTPAELEAGVALINRLSSTFFAEDHHDEQADRIEELLHRKRKGLPAPKHRASPTATTDDDLIKTLRRSLDEPPPALPETTRGTS